MTGLAPIFLRRAWIVTPILFTLCACAATKSKPTPLPAASETQTNLPPVNNESLDPCADRLHELSGLLLQYYGIYHTLPANLQDAAKLAPKGLELLTCPTSHRPYVYDPQGPTVTAAGGKARLVVYDDAPIHHGTRYGIVIAEPSASRPLSADVKEVPEILIKKSP